MFKIPLFYSFASGYKDLRAKTPDTVERWFMFSGSPTNTQEILGTQDCWGSGPNLAGVPDKNSSMDFQRKYKIPTKKKKKKRGPDAEEKDGAAEWWRQPWPQAFSRQRTKAATGRRWSESGLMSKTAESFWLAAGWLETGLGWGEWWQTVVQLWEQKNRRGKKRICHQLQLWNWTTYVMLVASGERTPQFEGCARSIFSGPAHRKTNCVGADGATMGVKICQHQAITRLAADEPLDDVFCRLDGLIQQLSVQTQCSLSDCVGRILWRLQPFNQGTQNTSTETKKNEYKECYEGLYRYEFSATFLIDSLAFSVFLQPILVPPGGQMVKCRFLTVGHWPPFWYGGSVPR